MSPQAARQGANIEIQGVKQTIAAMKAFTPEIEKRLGKQIKEALKATKTRAEGKYPKGAWVVGRSNKKLLGYVSAKAGGQRAARWEDSAPGIRAAIFEFAGDRNPGATPQARGLINSLESRYGSPGRFLWAAWDETGQAALDKIKDAVESAERELQAHLNSIGEAF